jgi:formylglycine-generating enzyme required for sulfatase activity
MKMLRSWQFARYPALFGLGTVLLWSGIQAQVPTRLNITPEGDQVVLTWNSMPGGQYQLYVTPTWAEAWVEVETSPKPLIAEGSTLSYTVQPSAEARFYRVAQLGEFEASRLVWIAPGTFVMGSAPTDRPRDADELPQTVVTITRGFWMGKYEVTQGEYLAVMGENPSWFNGDRTAWGWGIYDYNPDLPAERMSWYEAVEYCERLTEQERDAGRIPAESFYRLPTEAEWEYACRAGTTTRFFYGDDDAQFSQLTQYAWYDLNSDNMTHPVGLKLPNPWGLYDMVGNVYEWVHDWFGDYPGGSVTDPTGPETGTEKVIRGSSFYRPAGLGRSANRHKTGPDTRYFHWGMRVVLDPGQP